jgi:hypothetical protein
MDMVGITGVGDDLGDGTVGAGTTGAGMLVGVTAGITGVGMLAGAGVGTIGVGMLGAHLDTITGHGMDITETIALLIMAAEEDLYYSMTIT